LAPAPRKATTAASFKDQLALAHRLADVSAAAIMPHFRRQLAVENKGGTARFDPVTVADKAAERDMSRLLAREHPDHGLVGEEHGSRPGAGRYTWVLDPIDGTKGFVVGSPMWGTLIGLLEGDAPVLGMMNQPFTGERIWSGTSGSSWRQPDGRVRRVKVRACPSLTDAVLMSTSPDFFADGFEREHFDVIRGQTRMTRFGGDCYAYCLLAAGFVDIVVEAGLKPYDIVALIPIIERAGGIITTWDGKPATSGGRIVAAGDRRVHAAAIKMLSQR
jgi:myo-inositol-1(or 4)-monophosphatase